MKNKGYYGWIHSLNEAGIQAQRNGFEILAEQRTYKGEMLNEAYKPNRSEAGLAAKKARSLVDSEKRRAAKAAAAESAGKAASSGEGELSDFDFSGFQDRVADVRAEKQAAGSGVQRVETGFHGADEVDDSYDPTDPDSGTEEIGRLPDYPIAREARAETARLSIPAGDANAVANDASDGIMGDEDEPEDEGKYEFPTKNWKTVKESLSQKISRIMNEGKKAVRGRIVTGGDSEIPARSPNSLDAPKGIFKGTESPSEKVGRILEIVRDGPEKHGQDLHSWATSALDTMQKQLRKN